MENSLRKLNDDIEYLENLNKRLEQQCTHLHDDLFSRANNINDTLKEEILKLMTQKTKQINNNYQQIKDKITLRENSFKNDHKGEDFKQQKLNLDFDSVSEKSKKNDINDDEHDDYYKRQFRQMARQNRNRMTEAANQRHLKSSTISGTTNELPTEVNIHVNDIGKLKLPLSETQAQNLIKVCTQASYGLNSARFIDKNVRDSFQLEPHQFEIKNLDWQSKINKLAKRAYNEMKGFGYNKTEDSKIYAKLHKMLLYKKNGHFIKHQDNTSKDEQMFGTLIVQLPSEYTGGELITYYENQSEIHDFGQSTGKSKNEIYFAAYYAYIEHEVKPIISGYRLVLVYMLCCSDPNFNTHREILDTSEIKYLTEIKFD